MVSTLLDSFGSNRFIYDHTWFLCVKSVKKRQLHCLVVLSLKHPLFVLMRALSDPWTLFSHLKQYQTFVSCVSRVRKNVASIAGRFRSLKKLDELLEQKLDDPQDTDSELNEGVKRIWHHFREECRMIIRESGYGHPSNVAQVRLCLEHSVIWALSRHTLLVPGISNELPKGVMRPVSETKAVEHLEPFATLTSVCSERRNLRDSKAFVHCCYIGKLYVLRKTLELVPALLHVFPLEKPRVNFNKTWITHGDCVESIGSRYA